MYDYCFAIMVNIHLAVKFERETAWYLFQLQILISGSLFKKRKQTGNHIYQT